MSRNVAWHFAARSTSSSDPAHLQRELEQLDGELKHSVLTCERFPQNLRNIEYNYKISEWETARTETPIKLPVEGYVQSDPKYAKDKDNLTRWFPAGWSPVLNGLRADPAYKEWALRIDMCRCLACLPSPQQGAKRKVQALFLINGGGRRRRGASPCPDRGFCAGGGASRRRR